MNNLFFSRTDKILIQGATGREGRRAVEFMKNYDTLVAAGVTPGKGGQEVLGVPIFNSISEAIAKVGEIKISSIYVPPLAARAAVEEAVDNKIKFIHLIAEGIPYKDLAYIIKLCRERQVTLLGPGSLGILIVGQGGLGMIGGVDSLKEYRPGSISVISRSGGMSNEIPYYLSLNSLGLRSVIHQGSEPMIGLDLLELIKILETDEQTKTIAVFEEETYSDLSDLVEFFKNHKFNKRLIINLAGRSKSVMPKGVSFGHAEALSKKDDNLLKENMAWLKQAGVIFVDSYEEFINQIN